jgi:hypothetical protein
MTTMGDLSACKSKQTLIQLLTVNTRLHIDSSGAMGNKYPTLGMWSIYDDYICRIVLNSSYLFSFLVPFLFQIK